MLVIVKHIAKKDVEYHFDKETIFIGRSDASDIIIDSNNISRLHLEIKIEEDKIFIKDASAKNWISYNGEQLSKTEFVQYFDFMPLVLPDNYTICIEHKSEADEDENHSRTISRSDLLKRSKPKTRSKRALQVLEQSETKPTKINPSKNSEDELEDEDDEAISMKKWLIVIAICVVFLVGYAYFRGVI